jgi:hypothetical protein
LDERHGEEGERNREWEEESEAKQIFKEIIRHAHLSYGEASVTNRVGEVEGK